MGTVEKDVTFLKRRVAFLAVAGHSLFKKSVFN